MIKEAIAKLVSRESLTEIEAAGVMQEIMEGQATPSQLSAFIVALKMKGETSSEIAGLARTMRAKAIRVNTTFTAVDIVGTGGDGAGTFNISTAAALVAAGAGLKVAKHGNRAASSRCGSADVLEMLGVNISMSPEVVSQCLDEAGIAFMFAPTFHPAMKHAGPTRREIGLATVFNILGPLTNPAGVRSQVLGVAKLALLEQMASVMNSLGHRHALVVHGDDGLDEITITGVTHVCEVKEGTITRYQISPRDFGLQIAPAEAVAGGTAAVSAAILTSILRGETGPRRDVVLMNAAAALFVGDAVASIQDGISLAAGAIDSGKAMSTLEKLIQVSNNAAGVAG